jgi:hypothetical protein
MSGFWAELKRDAGTRVPVVAWICLTTLTVLSGPFGSYEAMGLAQRLVVWSVLVTLGLAIGIALRAFVFGVIGLRDFRRGAVLTAVLVSLVMTAPLWWIADTLFAQTLPHVPSLIEIAVFLFSASLAVGAFRSIGAAPPDRPSGAEDPPGAGENATTPGEPPAEDAAKPRLLDRLPADLQTGLWAISGRDHYVDVVTATGSARVLLRFADAVAEAAGVDGDQVHRSHWVAWAAVRGAEKRDGKVWLLLADGRQVPVSRNHRDKVIARGLG